MASILPVLTLPAARKTPGSDIPVAIPRSAVNDPHTSFIVLFTFWWSSRQALVILGSRTNDDAIVVDFDTRLSRGG